jgi:hypothetical protein
MDYIVAIVRSGVTNSRKKYTCRTAAIELFERLTGQRLEPQVKEQPQLQGVALDGSTILFRTRN